MQFEHDFVLRPRFTLQYKGMREEILDAFYKAKAVSQNVAVLIVDDRIFLSIPAQDEHYWSPQMEVEILLCEQGVTKLKCRFGPKPAVWTMFMFLHFVVAGLFISFAIWTYTNYTLDIAFALPLFLTLLMMLFWFVLYAGGRMGRHAGKDQMQILFDFFKETLPT